MKDTNSVLGLPKVFFNKFIKKKFKKKEDGFNTRDTDQLFYSILVENKMLNDNPFYIKGMETLASADSNSLLYWSEHIKRSYH